MSTARKGSTTWAPPQEFEEYRIIRVLGEGAMGKVFLAHDTVLDRPVALKFLHSSDLSELARDRFLIEARALARLQHPNVVAVYRVSVLGRRPYLVSEFVHGTSLDKIDKPVESTRVLELAIGLARGLSAAHHRGVLHRDIKPGNTILTDTNEVKLLDFGLAKVTSTGPQQLTPTRASSSHDVGRRFLTPVPDENLAFDATGADRAAKVVDPNATAALEPAIGDDNTVLAAKLDESTDLAPRAVAEQSEAADLRSVSAGYSSSEIEQSGSPSLTREGALMGTPYYMAPEVWRSEPATERSDLYSLGALLYELLAGHPPHRARVITELLVRVQEGAISELPDAVPADLAAIVIRCLARDPSDRFASADALRIELEALQAPRAAPLALPEGNPYPGLHAFEAPQHSLFFGRDTEVRSLVERLRTDNLVVLAGDSGIGKSSVCHAGVGPAITSGALGDRRTWQTVTMHPGRRPILSLVSALGTTLGLDAVVLEQALTARDATLSDQRRQVLRSLGSDRGVLLILDHFEELVTIADTDEATSVAEFLAELLAARSPGFRVLAAVRGDYLTRAANLPGLGDQIARALYMLRPLTDDGIAQAITGPLHAKGGRFEPSSMVDELIAAARMRGGLPLVQFALAELWNARTTGNVISGEALRDLGGVAGALTRHADSVIAGLRHTERKQASRMLLALIAADGSRSQRTRAQLIGGEPAAEASLEALLKGRLIVMREDDGAPAYEIAHDALIQQWDLLRRWLDDDDERRIVRRRIDAAADEWHRLGEPRELLWRDRRLAESDRVSPESLAATARAFLAASRAAVRLARRKRLAIAIGIPLAILAVIVLVRMQIQAAEHRRTAEQNRLRDRRVGLHVGEATKILAGAAVTLSTIREQQRAVFNLFDSGDQYSESEWVVVLQQARDLDGIFSRSSQELEHALVIDPARDDVRKKLAELLHQRAQLANDFHNAERREELLRRLALYDTAGTFLATWKTQATIDINITPPVRTLMLASIEREGTRRVERKRRPISGGQSVSPGDYVLIAQAPDRAEVRFPFRAGPGETVPITFELPESSAVPPDFVFIPMGSFLVGSADEGARTSFLSTVPIHEATTSSFLIARHETTFGEWITFLETLPPKQRKERLPRSAGAQNLSGRIELSKADGRWMLELHPTTHVYTARQGEPFRYLDRTVRAQQDWSRFPVIGVSLEDVYAYTAWLAASGRVPRARPCTEHEWERAARGADDREFPHGDVLVATDANFDETYGKQPRAFGVDEIGLYPTSRSPFGIDDLAGNVFEWTVATRSGSPPAIRGGAFYFGSLTARLTNRNTLEPTARSVQVGVRVCASPE